MTKISTIFRVAVLSILLVASSNVRMQADNEGDLWSAVQSASRIAEFVLGTVRGPLSGLDFKLLEQSPTFKRALCSLAVEGAHILHDGFALLNHRNHYNECAYILLANDLCKIVIKIIFFLNFFLQKAYRNDEHNAGAFRWTDALFRLPKVFTQLFSQNFSAKAYDIKQAIGLYACPAVESCAAVGMALVPDLSEKMIGRNNVIHYKTVMRAYSIAASTLLTASLGNIWTHYEFWSVPYALVLGVVWAVTMLVSGYHILFPKTYVKISKEKIESDIATAIEQVEQEKNYSDYVQTISTRSWIDKQILENNLKKEVLRRITKDKNIDGDDFGNIEISPEMLTQTVKEVLRENPIEILLSRKHKGCDCGPCSAGNAAVIQDIKDEQSFLDTVKKLRDNTLSKPDQDKYNNAYNGVKRAHLLDRLMTFFRDKNISGDNLVYVYFSTLRNKCVGTFLGDGQRPSISDNEFGLWKEKLEELKNTHLVFEKDETFKTFLKEASDINNVSGDMVDAGATLPQFPVLLHKVTESLKKDKKYACDFWKDVKKGEKDTQYLWSNHFSDIPHLNVIKVFKDPESWFGYKIYVVDSIDYKANHFSDKFAKDFIWNSLTAFQWEELK